MPDELHTVSTRALLTALGVDLSSKMRALLTLKRGGVTSRDEFVEYVYGGREDGGPAHARRIADHAILALRNRNVPVVSHPGRGFQLRTGT